MTFLQPELLWGLPLVLLPVIIHLVNRLRHRPQPWAAMQFLLAASRSSTSHAKLKQWLILLLRTLALLMLILLVSRPLSGGWLGWAVSGAPDTILILLDRSASMETKSAGSVETRRERALRLLTESAQPFAEASHFVLIDSALRTSQDIGSIDALANLQSVEPTDTAADLPAMLQTAVEYLVDNKSGVAELWIASDLQRSNWQIEDERWKSLTAQIAGLPLPVKVRLLALNEEPAANTAVTLRDLVLKRGPGEPKIEIAANFERNTVSSDNLPVELGLNGGVTRTEVNMEGQSLRWRQALPLPDAEGELWGRIGLPADANSQDNAAYFALAGDATLKATVVATDPDAGAFLRFASGTLTAEGPQFPSLRSRSEFATSKVGDESLLVWQGALPQGDEASRVKAFAEEGGVVVFFPPGQPSETQFLGLGWAAVGVADEAAPYTVDSWDQTDGPLVATEEGIRLPVNDTLFFKRQLILGTGTPLATFADGETWLMRQVVGRGQVVFCASLPHPEWSTLDEGFVLVPMMQRLLAAGSARLNRDRMVACGQLSVADRALNWQAVDGEAGKDIRTRAGVYQHGTRLIAVNRPTEEDEPGVMEAAEAKTAFGDISVQLFSEKEQGDEKLQGEIWRILLFVMLLFMLGESLLVLPAKSAVTKGTAMPLPKSAKPAREPALTGKS